MAIGVFDSGVGGLTVLRALRRELPGRDFIYLGDTARLPYGTKSAASVVRYAEQAADALVARGLSCLVIACNTASAVALDVLRRRYAPLPVVGVIEPGAAAAVAASRSGRIAVIATEGTVNAGAYDAAIRRLRPDARVLSAACALFVALAEEGWTEGEIVELTIRRYLEPLLQAAAPPDVLLLGCTHFPVLAAAIRQAMGQVMGEAMDQGLAIVDSAATTASVVRSELRDATGPAGSRGSVRLLATDGVARFARVGSSFLGEAIVADAVELVDLGR
ncbi:MAG: glutamate racemase [Gammaproteobacteria bacterium]|nr:MAG: glutamate racemase [Pseudomonadota bacterium]MBC6946099.1 glutamate racemase [Gammaproteobacteria bacterium]MCL4777467.1 glutamate racemase [Gammaproteobacteria bacterium]MDL1879608.1 glutamate racemase [Gammaproteobacteria bacterium PRO2]GIK33452.1 MAG: glutamate racemase [Gammaproteobacteria bacterium]